MKVPTEPHDLNPDRPRRQTLQGMAGILASMAAPALMSSSVWAQSAFPNKPITLIAPWPPGGSSDAVMRAFAESASRALGVSVIVDNRPGAGGTLGATAMVNAKPDGYMLTQLPLGIYRLPHMQKMAFDPVKDLTHIACLTGYTFGVVVRSDSPIKSIADLVAFAKANPGKFTYGSTGNGTTLLGRVRTRASACELRDNGLVDECLVHWRREGGRQLNGSHLRSSLREDVNSRHQICSALLTMTSAFFAPGTEPLRSSRFCAPSERTMVTF